MMRCCPEASNTGNVRWYRIELNPVIMVKESLEVPIRPI